MAERLQAEHRRFSPYPRPRIGGSATSASSSGWNNNGAYSSSAPGSAARGSHNVNAGDEEEHLSLADLSQVQEGRALELDGDNSVSEIEVSPRLWYWSFKFKGKFGLKSNFQV